MKFTLSFCLLLLLAACTEKKEISPEQKRHIHAVQEMTKTLAGYDAKIKGVYFDHGLKNQLIEEKELLRSRLERLKERGNQLWDDLPSDMADAPPAGHH